MKLLKTKFIQTSNSIVKVLHCEIQFPSFKHGLYYIFNLILFQFMVLE